MKKINRNLLFFSIFAAVLFGLEYIGQASDLLPRKTLLSNLLETAIVGLITTIFFALWTKRRQKRSPTI
jgi:hypothetical protein